MSIISRLLKKTSITLGTPFCRYCGRPMIRHEAVPEHDPETGKALPPTVFYECESTDNLGGYKVDPCQYYRQ